jgi:hypothetical protein
MSLHLVYNFIHNSFEIINEDKLSSVDSKTSESVQIPQNPLEFYVMTYKPPTNTGFKLLLITPPEYNRIVDKYIRHIELDTNTITVNTRKAHIYKFDVISEYTILPTNLPTFAIHQFTHL